MIDIEKKKREAFEKLPEIAEILKEEKSHFNGDFYSLPFNSCAESFINGAWYVFQQPKAQAVPEGFVLVSQKELLELAIAINAVDLATHTEGKPNEVREMWQQVALKLDALCSTGASQ